MCLHLPQPTVSLRRAQGINLFERIEPGLLYAVCPSNDCDDGRCPCSRCGGSCALLHEDCAGSGCAACRHEGDRACPSCNGRGTLPCAVCLGHGKVPLVLLPRRGIGDAREAQGHVG